jgi:VanZ family protein
MSNFALYWLPPIAWMIIISPFNALLASESTSSFLMPLLQWLLPFASQSTVEIIHLLIRKTGHFLEYAFLALLLVRAFRGYKQTWRFQWILYAGLIATGYAAMDEYMQSFMPTRTGAVYDWFIDTSGVCFSLGMVTRKIIWSNRFRS